MPRAATLAAHLPTLYREGALVDAFLQLWGVQLDLLDEAALVVQRSHWFDVTPDFDEAAALGALLGIPPEEFHADVAEYRAWVHALVDARLREGAVTREALRVLVDTYAQGFQRAVRIDTVPPFGAWSTAPGGVALVENPSRFRSARLPAAGGWEPLAHLSVTNAGIDPAPWAVVLTGMGDGPEYAPLIANRTTGAAMVFRGAVPVGGRLVIAPSAADRAVLRAELDGRDVTDRLDVYPDLVPGPAGPGPRGADRTAPRLALGANDLWFLPLAHYDTPGLDRVLLALADDALRVGRFDQTAYDGALFALTARISAWVAWVEHEPASLEIRLPAQALRTGSGTTAGITARTRLETGLDVAVDRTAGAGVRTEVVLSAHTERQPSQAYLRQVLPQTVREVGPTGADRLADGDARLDLSDFDESVLR